MASIKKNHFLFKLIFVLILLFIISGILEPFYVNIESDEWREKVHELSESNKNHILSRYSSRENGLLELNFEIKKELESNLNGIQKFLSSLPDDFEVIITDQNANPIYWTNNFATILDSKPYPLSPSFVENDLTTVLQIYDTQLIDGKSYQIFISEIFEKKYQLNSEYFRAVSFEDQLEEHLKTEIAISYGKSDILSSDGRESSFEIVNTAGKSIAVVTQSKITQDLYIKSTKDFFSNIQRVIVLLILISIASILLILLSKSKSRYIKYSGILILAISLRYLLLVLKIPSDLISGGINDPQYFSSIFGSGIASSPLEFTISIIFLAIIIKSITKIIESTQLVQFRNRFLAILLTVISIAIYFLLLRGFGSVIRSTIFDSSIVYFRDYIIIPEPPILLMHFNLLFLGFWAVYFATKILWFIHDLLSLNYAIKSKTTLLVTIFIGVQLIGYWFDYLQPYPQSNFFARAVFITVSVFALYLIKIQKWSRYSIYSFLTLGGSVTSISLLIFFNGMFEKDSLNATAHELIRPSINWMEYNVNESMQTFLSSEILYQLYSGAKTNKKAAVLEMWSESSLQKESLESEIKLFDQDLNQIAEFTIGFDTDLSFVPSGEAFSETELLIVKDTRINDNKQVIRGLAPVILNNKNVGFLVISVVYDKESLLLSSVPIFLMRENPFINSVINLSNLSVMELKSGYQKFTFGDLNINDELLSQIKKIEYNSLNEYLDEINHLDKSYVVFSKQIEEADGNRKFFIFLEEKSAILALFDFFKVFFIHSILFIICSFILLIYMYYNKQIKIRTLKNKLLFYFLLVSVIPMIVLAYYFRQLTDERNYEALNYKLKKRAISVEDFVNNNFDEIPAGMERLLEKSRSDLDVEFNLYSGRDLIYSTQPFYYESTLFPNNLNPFAYDKLVRKGFAEAIVIEKFESFQMQAYYTRINLLSDSYIIRVGLDFNNITLPMSGADLDVFLFGIYSLAVLLIILLSTIVSNQISHPIHRLTSVSKAVAAGDFNAVVKGNYSGEVGELVAKFNSMIKELKQSHSQIAEFEREQAWKEMAKQVAHEIKNPLTPMKLSVQQLEAAYNDNSPKFDSYFKKVTKTLINQIDILKNIASEFSNFARMPNLKIESFDLVPIVSQSVNLFEDEDVNLIFEEHGNYLINADKEQLSRSIINLIRNSIQAEASSIELNILPEDEYIILLISDDGKGIPNEIIDKIFLEDFTTKKKGMGIGLSIAKRFMESIGGKIEIGSTSESGTQMKMYFRKPHE